MRPYVGSVKMIEPSLATITSFGLFSSLSCQCVASVSRVPSGRSRTTELVTCSQTIRFPSLSRVIPLHLLLGSRSTVTPSSGCQRRRLSPGMSLKWSDPSALQIGPSVNVQPVRLCRAAAARKSASASEPGGCRGVKTTVWRIRVPSSSGSSDLCVDALGGRLEGPSGSSRAHRERLAQDRHGGLGRRVCTEVEPCRPVDAPELCFGETGGDERVA